MKQKSIMKNSIFYMAYNVLNMLFPFLTSMYIARVLLPVSIGEVTYANNIVCYFTILAFLGIPTYGLREIANARDNKEELNKVFSELYIINGISTAVFSLAYYTMILIVPAFREHLFLHCLVGLNVVLNAFSISWLFEGLEEFSYMSVKNTIVKIVAFILLILFVRTEKDIIMYVCISLIGTCGSYFFNMFYARRFVRFTLKGLNLKRHMKSIFMLVVVNLAIEIYTLVDKTMLGSMMTKDHVAFYTYASAINRVGLSFTSTLTTVLVPRISYYYEIGKKDDFNKLLTKGLKTILILAIPIIIGIQFTSRYIICLLYGEAYITSVYVERVLAMTMIISPVGYLLGSRVMLVSNQENKMVIAVTTGAIVNIIGNYFFIQLYAEMGAAIASVISEFVVMIIYINFGRKVFKLDHFMGTVGKALIAAAGETLVLFLCLWLIPNDLIRTIVQVISGAATYIVILYLLKDEMFVDYMHYFIDKIRKVFKRKKKVL